MNRSHLHLYEILTLSPWIAARRLSQLPDNPFGLESALAWQALAMEKWVSAFEAGAAAMSACWAAPNPASLDRMAGAMMAPIARRVRANARARR